MNSISILNENNLLEKNISLPIINHPRQSGYLLFLTITSLPFVKGFALQNYSQAELGIIEAYDIRFGVVDGRDL